MNVQPFEGVNTVNLGDLDPGDTFHEVDCPTTIYMRIEDRGSDSNTHIDLEDGEIYTDSDDNAKVVKVDYEAVQR